MMNPKLRKASALGMLPAMALLALTVGCQDSTPQTKVADKPAPPPPPPAPTLTSVSELMAQLNISDKIVMPEDKAPATNEERRAVLELFDGFARGDQQAVSSYVSFTDRALLEDMVNSGQWENATKGITQIRLESGLSLTGDPCVLAVIQSGMHFQPQLWQLSPGTEKAFTFDSVYTPPDMMNKLHGTDWITAWYEIMQEELQLAEVPDEDLMPAQQILDGNTGGESAGNIPSGSPDGSPGRGPARAPGGTPPTPKAPPGRGPGGPGKR